MRQPASLAVRPERVRIMAANAANSDADNVLAGEVVELIYLGRFRKYVVRARGMELTVVQQIAGGEGPVFEPGQAVSIVWNAADAVAVPEAG